MDPRMDNGMNHQDIQDAVQTSSLDPSWNLNSVASTADDFRPTTPLLPDEIAWVFDRAVAAEVRPVQASPSFRNSYPYLRADGVV